MLDNKSDEKVSLEAFSKLVGLPINIIREQLFTNAEVDEVSMADLRKIMVSYLNETMLTN